ncbi:hypothetical protein [Laspinema olomoucense]|uniref:hypothetical protein n=1 Tax=Laspinema olomoucense TaxID=3231600 RepID=UPI0021BA8148|nr:hypothetical protein [Laspinema sp. D3d]MCT7975192.1 hypothetical protein [Laspinema sp. D3d]
MNQNQINRLIEKAEAIAYFLELDPEQQDKLWPLIPKGIRSTIMLLDAIGEQPKTYEELAVELECHETTISQKLNIMAKFMAIELENDTAYAPSKHGGRPRRVAKFE